MYLIISIVLVIYFLPTIIVMITRHPERNQIALINLFLGWSIMFWVVSMRHAIGMDTLEKDNNSEK